jgi:cysteine desulfurase
VDSIYLDYNATTPVDPAVLEAMLPFLREQYGNPSSAYGLGLRARDAIESARAAVAALIGASPDEIVFTSCATESTNMAVCGAATLNPDRRAVVTSTIEHPATNASCGALARQGHDIIRVASSSSGVVEPPTIAAALTAQTALVTLIHAQNEIGTLQPVAEIARLAHAVGALMHADAAQSLGKVPVNVDKLGVDFLTIAGHKLYAPKGVGALYVRRGLTISSPLHGAGQEHGRRPGTENVAYIVGLGEACRLAARFLDQGAQRVAAAANRLMSRLQHDIPDLVLVGANSPRLPNTLNVLFPNVSGRALLEACPNVSASTGSACHAGVDTPSDILIAVGISPENARGAVRLSVGRRTTIEEVDAAAIQLVAAWRTLTR